jgi:hypothetical protein
MKRCLCDKARRADRARICWPTPHPLLDTLHRRSPACRSASASITCSCCRRRRHRAADQVLARASTDVHQVRDQPRERTGQGTATWRWPPAPPAPAGAPITHEPHRLHGDPLTHPLTQPVDLWMTANTGRRRRPNPSPRPSLQEGSESASDPNGHGGGATP